MAGLIFGLIGFGEIAEDLLRVARNQLPLRTRPAATSSSSRSTTSRFANLATGPGRAASQAQLVDRLTAAGAKRIFFDINFSYPSNPIDDQAFADAIERSGRVTLLDRARGSGVRGHTASIPTPLPEFAKHAKLGARSVHYNYENAVWQLPYARQ